METTVQSRRAYESLPRFAQIHVDYVLEKAIEAGQSGFAAWRDVEATIKAHFRLPVVSLLADALVAAEPPPVVTS